ncbi:MAG: T9SS type A sorting domain-containing protein [Bacteroidetes bacterium SB0662_bin_6]|nr:T9SS type A sorting domain-containing protein [Bacteroidetes bacterium SB0668_bin_1]MYE05341.1 T9SS type A sorting domain-containing protein [Bacteroidetes bacterium SB0662_bin_6]
MATPWFISRRPENRMPAMMSAYPFIRITMGLLAALIALMTMTPVQAQTTSATYTVTFQGNWTTDSTPGGVVSSAHFTRLVGAVHNDMVTFWESGGTATAGVESVAELGVTGTFESEVAAAGANASLVKQSIGGTGTSKATFDIEVTSDRPLFTLLSMIGPSPDWFVGVSGLSLLDGQGQWRSEREVDLFPYDAGTEDGNGFSLSNPATNPRGTITSIKGMSPFSDEPMAMLSFELKGTNVHTESQELPAEVTLSGNYPNPFNPETTIRYGLPKAGDVRLAVYNLLGHEVAILVDQSKAAGHHMVRFGAGDLPSGVYVYRLHAGDETIVRTMLLVK